MSERERPARSGTEVDSAPVVSELIGAEVLVVDRDPAVREGIEALLFGADLHLTCVAEPESALAAMAQRFFTVVIVDLDTPTPGAGLETVAAVKRRSPTSMVILLSPRKAFDDVVAAVRAGAVDVIWKSPEAVAYLRERVMRAADRSVGRRQVSALLEEARNVHAEYLERLLAAERRAVDLQDRQAPVDAPGAGGTVRVLVVAEDRKFAEALMRGAPAGFELESVVTGGEALDRGASLDYQIAIVAGALPDLPASMVVRNLKSVAPECIVVEGSPGGRLDMVEPTRTHPLVAEWTELAQLVERLGDLAEAYRVKRRERRYAQVFRERHTDFLRRYVELTARIDRALGGKS